MLPSGVVEWYYSRMARKHHYPRVELERAFIWHCSVCGRRHVQRGTPVVFESEEDREQSYREINGLEAWQELPDDFEHFEAHTVPAKVRCKSCLVIHKVRR